MRRGLICTVVLLSLLSGCAKDPVPSQPVLPDITNTGRNTMGCVVNGLVHVYTGKPSLTDPAGVSFTTSGSSAFINGNGPAQKGNVFIAFEFATLDSGAVYTELANAWRPTIYLAKTSPVEYDARPGDPFNEVRITTLNDTVAAGLFQFKAFNSFGDSVTITSGRFDIKLF